MAPVASKIGVAPVAGSFALGMISLTAWDKRPSRPERPGSLASVRIAPRYTIAASVYTHLSLWMLRHRPCSV